MHVFRADGFEEAFGRALELGRVRHEMDYLNGYGQSVRWRLDRILTLDELREDLDGAEVFSTLSDVSGGPDFHAVFDPAAHPPDTCGI